uniref:Uncharacterized protein n=1 Tax=Graphocephala atropunctata TaxID=36148 RepID=A0A1B6LBJ3_9HEMI
MEQRQANRPSQPPVRVQFRHQVIAVYVWLLCGLAISGVTAACLFQFSSLVNFVSNHLLITMIVIAVSMTLITNIFNRTSFEKNKGTKIMCWAVNCVLAGVPFLSADPGILLTSIIYTVLLIIILTLKSFILPEIVINAMLFPLTAIHTMVLVCSAYTIIFGSTDSIVSNIVSGISMHGGFVVYSGLVICNTQRLYSNAKSPQFDPLFSAFVFYMNILNLYTRVTIFSSKTYSA